MKKDKFWAGVCAYVCFSSLIQDALGKETYIEFVADNWASGWYTVPLAAAGLYLALRARDDDDEDGAVL